MTESQKESPLIKLLLAIIGLLVIIIFLLLGWKITKFQFLGVELAPPVTSTIEPTPTVFTSLPIQPSETAEIPNTPTTTVPYTATVQSIIVQATTVFVLPPLKSDINAPTQAAQGDFILADVLVSQTGNSNWLTLNGGTSGWGNIVYFEDNTTWVKPIPGASTGVYNGNYEIAKLASSVMFQSGCGLPDGCIHVYIRRISQGRVISEEIVEHP